MPEPTTPAPESASDRFRPKLLILGLTVLLAVIRFSAYNLIKHKKETAIDEATSRAQNLVSFFADNVESTLHYADDYIKTVRRIYLQTHSFSEIR